MNHRRSFGTGPQRGQESIGVSVGGQSGFVDREERVGVGSDKGPFLFDVIW